MAVADFLNLLISAASGLGGVFLGGWLTNRRDQKKARTDFITHQLSEFYGPLVAMRAEIQARGELRLKIEKAMDERHAQNLENLVEAGAIRRDEFEIFTDVSMPLYRRMLDTFREKIWLTEP